MRPTISLLLVSGILMNSASTFAAQEIKSAEVQIPVSSVHQVIKIVDKRDESNGTRQLLSVVSQSTPSKMSAGAKEKVYLTYVRSGDKFSVSASFLISSKSSKLTSATRSGPGKYEVLLNELSNEGQPEKIKIQIDATKLFADEEKAANWATDELFISGPLETAITIEKGRE